MLWGGLIRLEYPISSGINKYLDFIWCDIIWCQRENLLGIYRGRKL